MRYRPLKHAFSGQMSLSTNKSAITYRPGLRWHGGRFPSKVVNSKDLHIIQLHAKVAKFTHAHLTSQQYSERE